MLALDDLKIGIRMLAKHKDSTIIAVLTLALGIGANAGVFALINAAFLRRLPYPDSARIVHLSWLSAAGNNSSTTIHQYRFLAGHSSAFQAVAAYSYPASYNLETRGGTAALTGVAVSAGFFRLFGQSPILGRDFSPNDDMPAAPGSAILSYGVWQERFGGNVNSIGQTVRLNDRDYRIAGVLPRGFDFTPHADVWIPLLPAYSNQADPDFDTVARLKPGVTPAQAQEDAIRTAEEFRREFPKEAGLDYRGVASIGFQRWLSGEQRSNLTILFIAAGLLLLIAGANVTGLLLALGAGRHTEIATRMMLGASGARVGRQLVTESILLGLLSGVAALVAVPWVIEVLKAISPADQPLVPLAGEVRLDVGVFGFTMLLAAASGAAAGLFSLLRIRKLDLNGTLRSQIPAAGGIRLHPIHRVLVVGQVALTLVLLAGAALLIRSMFDLRSVKLGFDPQNAVAVRISLGPEDSSTASRVAEYQSRILDQLRALPGVANAAAAWNLPPDRGLRSSLWIKGRLENVQFWAVSPAYFETMGIPLLAGRSFLPSDTAGAEPVAIVNSALARRYWPNGNAVGDDRYCAQAGSGAASSCPRIVGVAGDVKELGPSHGWPLAFFLPQTQASDGTTRLVNRVFPAAFVLRTSVPVSESTVRRAIHTVDRRNPIVRFYPLSESVHESVALERTYALLMGTFAGLALLLAGIGVYGTISYWTASRSREIGVRVALGASPGNVRALVLKQAMRLVLVGVVLGLAGAGLLSRLLETSLLGVGPESYFSIAIVTGLLLGVGLVATYVPARRMTMLDPAMTLRQN